MTRTEAIEALVTRIQWEAMREYRSARAYAESSYESNRANVMQREAARLSALARCAMGVSE